MVLANTNLFVDAARTTWLAPKPPLNALVPTLPHRNLHERRVTPTRAAGSWIPYLQDSSYCHFRSTMRRRRVGPVIFPSFATPGLMNGRSRSDRGAVSASKMSVRPSRHMSVLGCSNSGAVRKVRSPNMPTPSWQGESR